MADLVHICAFLDVLAMKTSRSNIYFVISTLSLCDKLNCKKLSQSLLPKFNEIRNVLLFFLNTICNQFHDYSFSVYYNKFISCSNCCWGYFLGTLLCYEQVCNTFQERASIDKMYGFPVCKWVAMTCLKIGHQDSSPSDGRQHDRFCCYCHASLCDNQCLL